MLREVRWSGGENTGSVDLFSGWMLLTIGMEMTRLEMRWRRLLASI